MGLLLAPVFAVALLFSLGTTFLLVKDLIEARGDRGAFEAHMRHYSDRLEVAADGSFVIHRAPYPILSFFATMVLSWVLSFLTGYLLERLRRHVWSRASGGPARHGIARP
jgi:hypothetical protein